MSQPPPPLGQRPPLSKRKLALLLLGGIAGFIPGLLTAVGLFLTLWIWVPAPNFTFIAFGVAVPELSPWLIGLNTIAALSVLPNLQRSSWFAIALAISVGCVVVSSLPLTQFSEAHQQMTRTLAAELGSDYLAQVPPALQAQWRSQPLDLKDSWLGIPLRQVRVTQAIEFARPADNPLKLNVYRPLQAGLNPTIVVIHGGAWRGGSVRDNEEFSRYLAAQGYTVIALTYRFAPRDRFPAQITDVQTGLAFIQKHAAELEVDVNRVVLMGRSAGAHLAMLAAYQSSPLLIRAVVNYYGPVDLTAGYYDLPKPDPIDSRAVLLDLLGGTPEQMPDRYRQASPIDYIAPSLPPTLLIYAERDHLVQAKFGRGLAEALQAKGNRAVFLAIPWSEHAFDAIFNGLGNQLALYHTERFLAWAIGGDR